MIVISQGKAHLDAKGIRCRGPRRDNPSQICNKLLAVRNTDGLIAGNFKCDRCQQTVELVIRD